MKKSILSIVAIAFAAVSVLSSCDKNDDGYGQSAKTTTVAQTSSTASNQNEQMYNYCGYVISDEMASYGTWTVTITDGNKTAEYDIASQGKHGTYNVGNDLDQIKVTGYLLNVVKPVGGTLKATVKFTPNDKATSLKDTDEFKTRCGFLYATTYDPNFSFVSSMRVVSLDSECNNVVKAYSSAALYMSRN